jgi:thiol-disulfide isomerase/thioredoxin
MLILSAVVLSSCAPAVEAETVMEPEVHEESMDEPAEEAMEEPAMEKADEPADVQMEADTSYQQEQWYSWDLTDINSGTVFRVSDHQGKVVLVETMAIWCSNCLKQQKEVIRLHELLGEREDFISLGLNIDPNEDADYLRSYTQDNNFDWLYVVASPELVDRISSLYGVQYLNPPSTPMLIIDRQGVAHQLPFGIKSAEELQSALDPFLNEG